MSILNTFVTLDIETTGLNPRSSEIIEIGAVRVVDGEIEDRFHTYVKPVGEVPDEISRLIGVTRADLADAPRWGNAAGKLKSFVSVFPIMAYAGRFEARFLGAQSTIPVDDNITGIRDLAHALLPESADHRLDTLAAYFEVESSATEKSLREAEELAGICLGLIERLRSLPLATKQQMLRLLSGTGSDLLPILVDIGNEAANEDTPIVAGLRPPAGENLFKREKEENVSALETIYREIDLDEVEDSFSPDGRLAQQTEGYEHREQQVEMARAVGEAFNKGQILAIEAGTGVGKSLAYLAPAVRYAAENHARVIVSTNTKNLQEQLFSKDLPQLARTLDESFQYALLKGRGNYICLNRWSSAMANLDAALTIDERIAAFPLVLWSTQTSTGDISEHGGFDPAHAGGLWAKVCSDSGFCRSQKCKSNGRCFANNVRRQALKAHVVVVNHSLLFSDLSTEGGILGEYDHLIVDEAHNIERVAAQYLGRELNIWRVKNLCDQLRSPGLTNTGTLPALKHWMNLGELKEAEVKGFEAGIGEAEAAIEDLWMNTQAFFQDLTESARARSGNSQARYTEKLRYKPDDDPFSSVMDSLGAFSEATRIAGQQLAKLSNWMKDLKDDAFPNQDDIRSELDARVTTCQELLDDIGDLTDPNYEGWVYWMELPSRVESSDTRLFSAPLRIADQLEEALYSRMHTIIFTSATLGIRGRLVYFLRRMGLEDADEDRVKSLCLGSPFDFDKQALVCTAPFMPSPKDAQFQDAVDGVVRELAVEVNRGTLVLYTSYSMLNKTYGALKLDLSSRETLLLGQGKDGSRQHITERFKENRSSVLLGTSSFWEGVDLPGDSLEILGIVRLPFAVPSDPLVEAQMEELQKQGKDPFIHYSVPEAILKFRQGFGRLIRNATDRGVVIVMDNRVQTTRYGQAFLESLPTAARSFSSREEMIRTIREWFAEGDTVSRADSEAAD
jgi:predicted DnaQ family exonuclease/DinG family helicase